MSVYNIWGQDNESIAKVLKLFNAEENIMEILI